MGHQIEFRVAFEVQVPGKLRNVFCLLSAKLSLQQKEPWTLKRVGSLLSLEQKTQMGATALLLNATFFAV